MAILPKIVYNFNESDPSTIRDYSENGNDGTGVNLTITPSSSIGNDAVFNSATDQIDLGNITDLNGAADCSFHLSYTPLASTGTKTVFNKSGQISVSYHHTTNIMNFRLVVSSGTISVDTDVLIVGQLYKFDFIYENDIATLYIDSVAGDVDNTQNGVIVTNSNIMYLGDTGTSASALFQLNEFKLYNEAISINIINAVFSSPNGVLSNTVNDFRPGDIITTDLKVNPKYGIVTYSDNDSFIFLPLTGGYSLTDTFTRAGHLWDTLRQWYFEINDTPEICFYDGVSSSSEVLTESKKVYCLNKEGIINSSEIITSSYTVLSTDQIIDLDSSGGVFTVTLEADPTTNKEIQITDSVGSCGVNAVLLDGNGNNIVGFTTATMNVNNISYKLRFNGIQWTF